MSWSPIAQRFAGLPLILAGPILRRTEANSVTVWLALKQPGKVILTIYKVLADGSKGDVMFAGNLQTTKLGDHIHLVAATAKRIAATALEPAIGMQLQPDITYSYDIEFDGFDGFPSFSLPNLATPGVFSIQGDLATLCYAPYWRPTFALPPADLKDLHILHGSCRKPHGGEGEIDALPHADTIIESTCKDTRFTSIKGATTRPHQFYHTGDQIYADDVAGVLLYMLDDASKKLFGWVESLAPLKSELSFAKEDVMLGLPQDPGFANNPAIKYSIRAGQRLKTVQKLAGFSSDVAGDSHLIRFAEYACMYLFVWSDVLWPAYSPTLGADIYPTFGEVMPGVPLKVTEHTVRIASTPVGPVYGEGAPVERENPIKTKFNTEVESINKFHSTLPQVRRVLANVPSYMMCDDHEVTDDWFIGFKWCKRVYGHSLDGSLEDDGSLGRDNLFGRRIIQNGLMSFALFQGWGNKPADFAVPSGSSPFLGKPESALLGWVAKLATERGQDQATWLAAQQTVLPATRYSTDKEQGNVAGRRTLELVAEGKLDYSFAITFNNFKLVAINSRTERGLVQTPAPQLGPALLHSRAMQRQVQQNMRNLPSTVQVVLVICPAPVFGHAIVEGMGQKAQAKVDNILSTPVPSNYKGIEHRLLGTNPGAAPFVDGEYKAVETDWNEWDREGWSFNEECMESLLKELSVGKKVVLFSGDVHYGFSPYVSYHRPPSTATVGYPEKAAFIQLVCSSMKNSTVSKTNAGAAVFSSDLLEVLYPSGNTYAGWSGRGYHYYRHLLVGTSLAELLQKPYTPFEGDFFFTSIGADDSLTMLVDAADWSYTVKFALDERDTELRMAYPGADPNTAYTPPTGRLAKARYALEYSVKYNTQRLAVGHTQIGQVRLDLAQNKVYHNFWYTLPGQSSVFGPGPITQHIIPIPPI